MEQEPRFAMNNQGWTVGRDAPFYGGGGGQRRSDPRRVGFGWEHEEEQRGGGGGGGPPDCAVAGGDYYSYYYSGGGGGVDDGYFSARPHPGTWCGYPGQRSHETRPTIQPPPPQERVVEQQRDDDIVDGNSDDEDDVDDDNNHLSNLISLARLPYCQITKSFLPIGSAAQPPPGLPSTTTAVHPSQAPRRTPMIHSDPPPFHSDDEGNDGLLGDHESCDEAMTQLDLETSPPEVAAVAAAASLEPPSPSIREQNHRFIAENYGPPERGDGGFRRRCKISGSLVDSRQLTTLYTHSVTRRCLVGRVQRQHPTRHLLGVDFHRRISGELAFRQFWGRHVSLVEQTEWKCRHCSGHLLGRGATRYTQHLSLCIGIGSIVLSLEDLILHDVALSSCPDLVIANDGGAAVDVDEDSTVELPTSRTIFEQNYRFVAANYDLSVDGGRHRRCKTCDSLVDSRQTHTLYTHSTTRRCLARRILATPPGESERAGRGGSDARAKAWFRVQSTVVQQFWGRHVQPVAEGTSCESRWKCLHCDAVLKLADGARYTQHLASCIGISFIVRSLQDLLHDVTSSSCPNPVVANHGEADNEVDDDSSHTRKSDGTDQLLDDHNDSEYSVIVKVGGARVGTATAVPPVDIKEEIEKVDGARVRTARAVIPVDIKEEIQGFLASNFCGLAGPGGGKGGRCNVCHQHISTVSGGSIQLLRHAFSRQCLTRAVEADLLRRANAGHMNVNPSTDYQEFHRTRISDAFSAAAAEYNPVLNRAFTEFCDHHFEASRGPDSKTALCRHCRAMVHGFGTQPYFTHLCHCSSVGITSLIRELEGVVREHVLASLPRGREAKKFT